MASSGTGCLSWTFDRSFALDLFRGTLLESKPACLVGWFETDKQTEKKLMKSSEGFIDVQLPIPKKKGANLRERMPERLRNLFDEVSKDCSTIGFEIGQHETWETGELLDLLLTSWTCLARDYRYTGKKLNKLVICAPNPDIFSIAHGHCEAYFSGSKRENSTGPTGSVTKPVDKSQTLTVKVTQGCLEDCIADVLVCTTSPELFITGKSACALQKKSKNQLEKDLRDKYRGRKLNLSEVAIVKGSGDLQCKHVIAGAFDFLGCRFQDYRYKYKSENDFYQGTLRDFIFNCLQETEKLGHTTVAFPAIGVGLGYPVKIIAEQMFKSVQTFPSNGTLNTVTFVIYKLDNHILKEFKKAEETFGNTSTTYKATASAQSVKRKTSSLISSKLTDFKTPEDEDKNVTPTQITPHSKLDKDRMNASYINTASRLDFSSSVSSSTASYSQGARQKTVSRQSSLRCFKTFDTQHGIQVKFHQCNVVDAPTECICIPAAKDKLAGNVAHAVYIAADKDLSACASAKLKAEKRFKVGEVCDTEPGKIKGKSCIVHTVVPEWEMYKPFSESNVIKCETEFSNCIVKSLTHVEKLKIPTMAFSPMSVGQPKIPNDLCAAMYVKAVVNYDHVSSSPLKEIYFVDKDEKELRIIEDAFHDVLQMWARHPSCYNRAAHIERVSSTSNTGRSNFSTTEGRSGRTDVEPRTDKSRKIHDVNRDRSNPKMIIYPFWHVSKPPNKSSDEFTCWFNKRQKLFVYTDDITSLRNIEMIVCNEKPNGKGEGKLAKALGEKLGSSYKKSKETEFKRNVKPGDVIVCSSIQGILKPKWIAHAVLYWKTECNGEKDRKKKVEDIFTSIFDQASAKGCKSIAMPVLGSGKGNADPEYYTERLFFSLLNFCDKTKHRDIFVHLVNIRSAITDTAIATVKKAVSKSPNLNQSVQPKAISEPRKPERPKDSTRNDSTYRHRETINKENRESKQPEPSINIPAATSSHGTRQPIQDTTEQTEAEIPPKPNTVQKGNVRIFEDDDDDDDEEVLSNLRERDKDSNERTNHSKERDNDSNSGYSEDDDDNSYVQRSDSDDENDEGASCQAKDSKPNKTEETCVICMETVKKPKILPCRHVFCEDCIEQQFTYKEACPTCGRVVGTIEGDQPDGKMTITIDDLTHCAGFEHVGQFIITYSFENGKQGPSHPNPGAIYKGITRKAFLPKNEKGKRICKMLWVAFKRRLVFTVGSSRTTGKEGVITWNDIHHKTDPKPNSQFGYPDDSYLDRVTDELKAKGVTEVDIVEVSLEKIVRRERQHRR